MSHRLNVLGNSMLRNGYLVRYRVGASTWTAFLLDLSDAEESKAAFAELKRFYEQKQPVIDIGKEIDAVAFSTEDAIYGPTLVFRKGRIVGGTLGAPESLNIPFAQNMLAQLPPG